MSHATSAEPLMDVLSILVVEDEDFDAAALFRQLDRALPIAPNVHRAGTLAEASSLVGHGSFDVAFLDLCLPDGQSEACLEWLQEAAQKMPVIVLTGLPDDLLATSALRKGAQDYLVKERMDPTAVMRSLRFAVERYRLQHELVAARTRESQLRDRLLSHVSHELRTPLTAIVQFGAILRDGIAGAVNTQQAEYLDIIARNAGQLKAMIGALMDVSRAENGKLQCDLAIGNVAPLIAQVAASAGLRAEQAGLRLSVENQVALPRVMFDPTRLVEVIENLIDNALKFTPPGGEIQIRTGVAELERTMVTIEICDSGVGIPEDKLESVFERLSQLGGPNESSRRGLGLGLYLCREIVQQHGGRIQARRNRGAGTTFRCELPAYSLADYVGRVVRRESTAPLDVCLIQVLAEATRPGAAIKGAGAAQRLVSELVDRCIVQHSDVVLPAPAPLGGSFTINTLIRSGPEGAAAVERRLRQAIAEQTCLATKGYSLTIRSHHLPVRASDGGWARTCQAVTEAVENLINAK